MTRAPIVLTATVAGLAATLGFHAHAPQTTASATATASSPASGSTTAASTTSSSGAKTVTSDAVATQYGDVQLRVTVAGGKITAIEPVALPANDPRSVQINAYAAPLLRQSALSKQSADVDGVSGATYTSNGYRTALQSALDKAGVQASGSSATSA